MDLSSIENQTIIFSIILLTLILVGIRKTDHNFSLTKDKTTELKGFAILTIIFAHIGYFLVSDHSFLFPLSVLSGTSVNLFLFLSGYGLIASALKSNDSMLSFYKKRLVKLFIPLWVVLTLTLLADKFILSWNFPLGMIIQNYLGYFSSANPRYDLNSPLWYFSLILFFYLLFPIFLNKKKIYLTSIFLTIFGVLLINLGLPATVDIFTLYKLHFLTFPLGIFTYYIFNQKKINILRHLNKFRPFILILSTIIIAYTAIHSNVGSFFIFEQLTSLFTMFFIILFFIFLPVKINLFKFFGIYSYEIYLIHWPILSRFDPLYSFLPLWAATLISLFVLIILGIEFQKVNQLIFTKITSIKTQA